MGSLKNQALVLSGGSGKSTKSARAGFLPISLGRAPPAAFEGIPVYLRTTRPARKGQPQSDTFSLYCGAGTQFTEEHRQRLSEHGVRFVYIPVADQARFRYQTEAVLLKLIEDPSLSVSVKSEIVYETSVEFVNELLTNPDLAGSPRLDQVSRAVTMMVLNDSSAFSHLFAASHHDFYTATHMVNVATWMVPLAYTMGHRDPDELNHICKAGLLHDIGKIYIPSAVLNKKGRLSDREWALVRQHPEMGCRYLEKVDGIDPLIMAVTREHHERLDGSGYPRRLRGNQIHPISRICAIVDTFDAMTAFRPYKVRTMTAAQALRAICDETPHRHDSAVFKAWLRLLQSAQSDGVLREPAQVGGPRNGRRHTRFRINCPARLHILQQTAAGQWNEAQGLRVMAHNISRSGLGILSQVSLQPGERVRVYMEGPATLRRTDEGLIVRCRSYRDGCYEVGITFG